MTTTTEYYRSGYQIRFDETQMSKIFGSRYYAFLEGIVSVCVDGENNRICLTMDESKTFPEMVFLSNTSEHKYGLTAGDLEIDLYDSKGDKYVTLHAKNTTIKRDALRLILSKKTNMGYFQPFDTYQVTIACQSITYDQTHYKQ